MEFHRFHRWLFTFNPFGVGTSTTLAGRDLQSRPSRFKREKNKSIKRFGRGCKPRPAKVLDGVANPVLQSIKRFGRSCKPRPAN
jgi:hypothetical protein